MRFRPSAAVEEQTIERIPEVGEVNRDGSQIVVTGTGNVVQVVSSFLADRGVIAEGLRVDQTSLEDAYLQLTARSNGSTQPNSGER